MASFAFLSAILLVALFCCCQAAEKTCVEVAKEISNTTKEFHEPKGTWEIYKTNKPDLKCMTFTYEPLNVSNLHLATTFFKTKGSNEVTNEAVVTVVAADTNQYVSVSKATGQVRLNHRLSPTADTENRHFFISFNCDDEGKFVKSFTSFIDNESIKPTVDKMISEAKLPFAPGFKLVNAHEECGKPEEPKPKKVV